MAEKQTSLPPLSVLFKETWTTFKGSVLNLFILNLVSIGIFIGIGLLALIISLPFGIFSIVSAVSSNKLSPAFFSSLGAVGIIILVAIVVITVVGFAFQAASFLFIDTYKTKPGFGKTFRKGFSYVLPLFLLGLFSGVLVGGAYFLFIIPGIVLAILFSFAPYEVVLRNQRVLPALRRSIQIVSANFWGIVGRILLWFIIVLVVSIIPHALLSSKGTAGSFPLLSTVVNVALGWLGICYSIALYKQARAKVPDEKGGRLLWPIIISVIGWIIGVIVLVSLLSLITFLITQGLKENKTKQKKIDAYKAWNLNTSSPSGVIKN